MPNENNSEMLSSIWRGYPLQKHEIVREEAGQDRTPTFEQAVHGTFLELEELLLSKHNDYGPKNIANAPGGPHNGLRVRLYDKLARLSNWVESGVTLLHEPAEESYKDIANYGVIGLLVSRGRWPDDGN